MLMTNQDPGKSIVLQSVILNLVHFFQNYWQYKYIILKFEIHFINSLQDNKSIR